MSEDRTMDDDLQDEFDRIRAERDTLAARVAGLEERLRLADALATLVEEGECPWRDGTREYRDWWQDRTEAAAAYRAMKGGDA